MKRFIFIHTDKPETGFVVGLRIRDRGYLGWLGYGFPVWWKPRLLNNKDDGARFSFGFGWLLLCLQVKIVELELEKKEKVNDERR